jgi:plastocyanin
VRRRAAAPAAHAAADPTVAIKDFSFAPAALTIHAGETVTWVNEGPSSHTATGPGGFDTGILRTGQSASHQFTSPGTFSYICSIHPNMHATVVVLARAAAKSAPERPSASGQSAKSAPAEEVPRGPHLPNTGMNLLLESLVGLGLLLLGTVLLVIGRKLAPTTRSADGRGGRGDSTPPL